MRRRGRKGSGEGERKTVREIERETGGDRGAVRNRGDGENRETVGEGRREIE